MPYLSIIVPVYNAEKYLVKCTESILNQNFRDFELIFADDSSTDKSGKICDMYAEKYKNVYSLHTERRGVVSARKSAFCAAKGKYVGFADADDFMLPDMFNVLCEKAEKYNCDVAACGIYTGKDFLHKTAVPHGIREGFYSKADLEREIYPNMIFDKTYGDFKVMPALWNKIFKRESIEKYINNLSPHIITGEDAAITYAALFETQSFYYAASREYFYRQTPESATKKYNADYFMSLNELFKTMNNFLSGGDFEEQINMYIAKMAVYGVRDAAELTDESLLKKYRNIKCEYTKYGDIVRAVKSVNPVYYGKSIKPWLKLLKNDRLFMCVMLSHIKRSILN